jgi:hypothetical protein
MKKDTKDNIQVLTAVGMLVVGSALSVAGFVVAPTGDISDSVLWLFAQCLIYSGSIFGITIYVNTKFDRLLSKINDGNKQGNKE